MSLRTFVWTQEEAEAAWKAHRTERNLAPMLPENMKSIHYCSGGFMVDGIPATVTVCRNEWVKQQILTPAEKERFDKEQDRLERQEWEYRPDPKPIEGRTCSVCGGKLMVEILNYFWDRGTDHCAPADTKEKCLSCGRETAVITSGPPCGWW